MLTTSQSAGRVQQQHEVRYGLESQQSTVCGLSGRPQECI